MIEAAIILASIYLTFIIDVYTLNTVPKRVFVFCYFLLMGHVALFLKKKLQKGYVLPKYMLAAAGILAAAFVLLGHNTFFPNVQETTVSLAAVPCEDGNCREVWLTVVQVDGQEIQLSQLELDANQGWTYRGDYDDYVFYPAEGADNTNYLTFQATGEEIALTFAKNAWSGTVQVMANERNLDTLILTDETDTNEATTCTIHSAKYYEIWELVLYGAGAWIVMWFCLNVCADVWSGFVQKKSDRNVRKIAIVVLAFLNAGVLFFSGSQIQPTALTKAGLLILTGLSVYCVNCQSGRERMKKYRTRGCCAWLGAISVYASLASFGQRFFLDGNTRIHGSLTGLFYCMSGFIWFLPVIWMLLYCLEWLSSRQRNVQCGTISRRRAWWTLFISLAACQLVVLWIMWPGGFPSDAMDQLFQALGIRQLNDWHPVLHTLLERGILNIFHEPGMIIAIQDLIFVWLLTAVLMLGYEHGMSIGSLCFIGGAFILLPNQVISWTNSLKDYPYTLSLLWGLYLLLQIVLNSAWSRKISFVLCLALDIFFMVCLRHNGIVPAILVGVVLIVFTANLFQRHHLRLVASVCIAVLITVTFKGTVFQCLNVIPNTASPYTTMLCAVASCINKDLPLSDKTMELMGQALPIEDWKLYYSRYEGHDKYIWGREDDSIPYDASIVTGKEAFDAYFDALSRYPDVVIKDRIDGMDIMWDVAQPSDGFNARMFDFVYPMDGYEKHFHLANWSTNDNGIELFKQSIPAKAYHHTMGLPTNSVFDILLWRTGAYLITFLVLLVFWWKNRMGRLCWAAVPMLGNIAGSMLVLYHQSFRYVYFIQVSVLALIFITIALKQNWKAIREREHMGETSNERLEREKNHG